MSSSLASQSKQQQLRSLAASASSSARVTDKLAKYDTQGNLSCAICKSPLTQSQWQSHINSASHQQILESLRELARKKAAVAAGGVTSTSTAAKSMSQAASIVSAAPGNSGSKLSSGTVTSSTVVNKLAPLPSSVSVLIAPSVPESSPLAGLGAYDDDDEDQTDDRGKQSAITASSTTSDEIDSSLPSDFFDAGVAPAVIEAESMASNDTDTSATASTQIGKSIVAPVAVKTSNAFMIGASATHNPAAVSGKTPMAASSSTASLNLASSLPPPNKSMPSTSATRKDLSSEHAAFEAMLRDTAIEAEKQSKLDSLKLAKLRKLDEQEQSASYGDRLSSLKRAREEAKKKLEEQRAAKKSKLPSSDPTENTSNNAPPSALLSATSTLADDDASNPFLDWRAQGAHR